MKTVLITGASSGLGRAMADEALERGHRVIGTLRKEEQRAAFDKLAPGRSIGRMLDVTHISSIQPLINDIENEFGAIDVLVNNAGFGLRGVVEELDLEALRRQYEVNVFGPIALIKAVLPGMRKRRSGHIVNIVSMGGIITFPALSAYHGSKFALLGMNDALSKEVGGLGIHVTAVMPGMYRTDWSGRSQEHSRHEIPDYDTALKQDEDLPWGDPNALGRVVLEAIEMDAPPEHLLVGPAAITNVRERLKQWSDEIDRWENLSRAQGEG